jgi:peptide/nickel transport system substrate-binding protein
MKTRKEDRPKSPLFVLLVFLVLALWLQACAGAGQVATPAPGTGQETEAVSTPAEGAPNETPVQPPFSGEETVQPGGGDRTGVLRIAMEPIVQTDPAFISSDAEVMVAGHVYDYLVDITPENEIVPRLASEWNISDDGRTYVFQLAPGVTFHDGSPFTSEDVVWTFDRLRDPEAGLPTQDLYSNIASIEATGDLEVTFKLAKSNPFFLFDISDNHALILKAATEDPATAFNGTGPFRVGSYSPEDRILLEANKAYFIPGQPALAEVEIIFFSDPTAQVEALRSGQVDLAMRLSADLFLGLQDEASLQLFQVPTNQFDAVRLRADREPGSDPRVIQALKLATDREAIYQLVLQGFGEVGRDSPIGPMYPQYYSEAFPVPARDVAAARAFLEEAGYENGLDLELHVPDTGDRPNLAVVLKEQWAEAGVNVEVIVEPESVYYGDEGWLEVDLGITGWGSRPYPQFYLDVMLRCAAIWNEANWCDEEFDQLAEVAGTTLDEEERAQAYADIQRILIERGPLIIPYFTTQRGAIRDQYLGFEMKPFPGRSDLRPVQWIGP